MKKVRKRFYVKTFIIFYIAFKLIQAKTSGKKPCLEITQVLKYPHKPTIPLSQKYCDDHLNYRSRGGPGAGIV